jgi:hypothetical protein
MIVRMRRRRVRSALAALILVAVAPVCVVAQDLKAQARAWASPRTPWGDPDLQGAWTNQTTTPLERAAKFGARALLSDEEVADLQREADTRGDRPPAPGDPGSVNQFWNEPTRVLTRTSLIVDPPDGRLPALTPAAQRSQAARAMYLRSHPADSWEDRSPWERCFGRGMPRTGSNNGSNLQIAQGPGYVVVIAEVVHETRMIPVDGRPHLTDKIRQWNGDARGHWEGGTLVVETTNFLDRPNSLLPGIRNDGFGRSARALRVVERFTRVGFDAIDYQFTVHEPTTFTKPWTVATPMTRLPGGIFEYACHEGNYGLRNMLSGQRALENDVR